MTGTELLIASIALTTVATGVAVYGQVQAANAQDKNAKFQEELAARNAQAAENARASERIQDRKKFRYFQGRQYATAGASGVSGFEDLFADDLITFESEQLIKDYNTKITQSNYLAKGASDAFESRALASANRTGALGSAFQGASSAASAGASLKFKQETKLGGK
jgi:hypothetical protein